jgi:hypothetical protein
MEVYEVKDLKAEVDLQIFDLIKKFETKSGLEVIGVYINREDISQMGERRKTQLIGVEIQAALEPVMEKPEVPE